MEGAKTVVLAVLLIGALMPRGLASQITAPAFLWSPRHDGSVTDTAREVVDYRTFSPKELAETVMSEGGWSNFVCPREHQNEDVDIALVFVGKNLQSSDISKAKHSDPALVELLQGSFTSSNFSMAFPYIALSDEKDSLENSLISGFIDNCGPGVEKDHIAYLDSCSVNYENAKKLEGLHSLLEFVGSRKERGVTGQTDLIVFCSDHSEQSEHVQSEGEILSDLVKFLEESKAKYSVLYTSEPKHQFNSHLAISRFLAENTVNASANSFLCDGVCQLQSSLLEGFFVAIVLLIILISGLCCMMGIDTPTRFESPQES